MAGTISAASMPMMAITTSNSIKVKALLFIALQNTPDPV
jgi:hypothetical protein